MWTLPNLVSLVDPVDELLRRWVPGEPDGGGVDRFCLDILGWSGGHCTEAARKTDQADGKAETVEKEVKKKKKRKNEN